jgi:hypothetical protein
MKNILYFFALLATTSFAVFAQSTTSDLVGTVAGHDGLVPGASVTVRSNQSGQETTVTTNSDGTFRVPNLQVGTYTITVKATGFKTYTANEVKIEIGRDFSLNVPLEVGGIEETVVVTAGQEIINSVDAKINNNVSRKQLDDLPSLGRNPLNFVPLQPGAASNPSQNTVINGIRTSAANTTIDGINVQDNFIRSNATDFSPARPTVDEVEEFAVATQNNAGDGFGGAQIQFTTRRGTNRYNLRLFEFNRNSKFAANNFFNNANGVPRPFRNRNQFGGNFAGPLPFFNFGEGGPVFNSGKDKMFFFFSYEKLIDIQPADPQFSTVLTANARQGLFTYTAAVNDPARNITAGQLVTVNLFNPALGTGITGINPIIASRILANVPMGNSTQVGDQRNTTGFSVIQNFNQEQTNWATRIDYIVNPTNTINGVFRYVRQDVNRADIDNSFNTQPRVTQPSINPMLSLGWSSAFSSKFSNELRGGFFFSEPIFLRRDPLPANFLALPLITNPEVTFQDQGRIVDTYNLQDNATYIAGNHSLRFGGQFQAVKIDAFNNAGITPTFTIGTGTATPSISTTQFTNSALFPGQVPAAQRAAANSLLALLGGIVSGGSQAFNVTSQTSGFVPGATQSRQFSYEIYGLHFSDQWRVTNNLTLNLGLRYDLYTALRSDNGLALEPVIPNLDDPISAILDPNGRYQFVGGNVGNPGQFYQTDKNNFAPVISFAYSPNFSDGFGRTFFGDKQTVIRGGYRISYINDELVRAPDNALLGNQGLNFTANAFNPATGTTALNARIDNLPTIAAPTFVPNRTFALNNQAAGNFGTVFAVDPKIESPLVHEYTFGIQREIGFDTALEVRYVGTHSKNLLRGVDFNQVDITSNGFLADFNRARANLLLTGNAACTTTQNPACQPLTVFPNLASGGLLTNGTIQGLLTSGEPGQLAFVYLSNNLQGNVRFVPNTNAGVVDLLFNGAEFYYNALQVDVRRRFTQGFALNANYTFSKNLTNAQGVGQTRFEPLLNNAQPELEYARALFDQTHKFNLLASYELPFGAGKPFLNEGIASTIFGNFQLGAILQIGSGAPITITDARGTLNRTGRSGSQTAITNLSKQELKDLAGVYRTPNGVFFLPPEVLGRNPDGTLKPGRDGRGVSGNFDDAPFPGQVFFRNRPGGTSGLERSILNGPTTYNLDLSLIKRFVINERFKFQLQGDLFNALNNVNFIPGQFLDINSTNFGRISDAGNARITQLAFRFEF